MQVRHRTLRLVADAGGVEQRDDDVLNDGRGVALAADRVADDEDAAMAGRDAVLARDLMPATSLVVVVARRQARRDVVVAECSSDIAGHIPELFDARSSARV